MVISYPFESLSHTVSPISWGIKSLMHLAHEIPALLGSPWG